MVLKSGDNCQKNDTTKESEKVGISAERQGREEDLLSRLQKAKELAARQTA